jgi:hypothetical protein
MFALDEMIAAGCSKENPVLVRTSGFILEGSRSVQTGVMPFFFVRRHLYSFRFRIVDLRRRAGPH